MVTTKERSNIYTFKYTWCYLQNRLLGLFYDPHFELPNWFCCFSSCAPSPFQPRKFPFITGVSTNRPVVVRHQDLFGQQPGHRLLGALLKARSLNGVTCGLATVSRNVRWCHGVTRVGWRFFVFFFAKLKRCRTTGRYWKTGDLWQTKKLVASEYMNCPLCFLLSDVFNFQELMIREKCGQLGWLYDIKRNIQT